MRVVLPTIKRLFSTSVHFQIISEKTNFKVGSIFRRRDFGWRTAYTLHFNLELPVKHKALLVSLVFFLVSRKRLTPAQMLNFNQTWYDARIVLLNICYK